MKNTPGWAKDEPCPICGSRNIIHTRLSGRYVTEIKSECRACRHEEITIIIKRDKSAKIIIEGD